MKVKFKKRYVLGTGYPWENNNSVPTELLIALSPNGFSAKLNWPKELWDQDLPQYRLVLERVEKDKK